MKMQDVIDERRFDKIKDEVIIGDDGRGGAVKGGGEGR